MTTPKPARKVDHMNDTDRILSSIYGDLYAAIVTASLEES